MPHRHSGLASQGSRPFLISTLIITLLATYSLLRGSQWSSPSSVPVRLARFASQECRDIRHATDKCAFVLANCQDDEAGLLPYISFYYCTMGHAQPVAFIIMTLWLGLLFTTIGIAASDFFSVNLSTIARVLGLSESLAGVTFLALGNGSPDVFSTFAAMDSNSGSMAIGELIGAAGFISAVVAGSMALVREFKVSRRTFVRDICFFIAAVSFTMVFVSDGRLQVWECMVMVGFYLFYVLIVVSWHWISTRRRRRRIRETASRAHYFAATNQGEDELEPYRDEDDEEDDATPMSAERRRSTGALETGDISALERGPRVDIPPTDDAAPDEDEDERSRHVAAEMTSSMRVLRRPGRRTASTITPIRPSLVGVLEFRSVLSSLQKERNMRLAPVFSRAQSTDVIPGHMVEATQSSADIPDRARSPGTAWSPTGQRDRALSSGDRPLNLGSPGAAFHTSPSVNGRLAPPQPQQRTPSSHAAASHLPQLQIPSRGASGDGAGLSTATWPVPDMSESPLPITPSSPGRPAPLPLPMADRTSHSSLPYLGDQEETPKRVNWWPYRFLPPPHVLFGTLFPTLQGWTNKSIWDKFVSMISVPSILLLVVTLPVVETEAKEDEADNPDSEPLLGSPANNGLQVPERRTAGKQPESEWQRFRRNTLGRSTSSLLSGQPSPLILGPDDTSHAEAEAINGSNGESAVAAIPAIKSPGPLGQDGTTLEPREETPSGWNRWLVAVQIVTGPLWVVFIVWANISEGRDDSAKLLLRLLLYSLVGSLVLLALLLFTTSPDKKPRFHFLLCFLGFIISVAWISTVAGEVVGVLKALGVILDISEAILGLTIFAVGNSLGDLVADITVARLGYPMMALSACFGGPMLNILLGVGIGGLWMAAKSAHEKHEKHPKRPLKYGPYHIHVSGTLMISAITVLVTLVVLLVAVPLNKWVLNRKIGWGLIAIWSASTLVNVVCEITGVWSDIA